MKIFIPWLGPTSNKVYAGIHWAKRRKLASEGHLACLVAKSLKPIDCPVKLLFTPQTRSKRYDCSNYWLTCKIVEDGLIQVGVLRDDRPDYVTGFYIDRPIKGEPGIWVEFLL